MIFNHPGLICAFSSRPKNMSFNYGASLPKDVLDNRKEFLSTLGIDYRFIVCAKQAHGSHISSIQETDKGKGTLSYETAIDNTDALITDKKGVALAILTADCLSIFLYDAAKKAIGIVHAGWRSTRDGITIKTIELMQKEFSSDTKDLFIGFGPSIRNCCYEVKDEFNEIFPDDLIKRDNKLHLDLISLNKKQLFKSGVREENIFDSGICTSCRNEDFFSYRKEGASCGRIMSIIMLK